MPSGRASVSASASSVNFSSSVRCAPLRARTSVHSGGMCPSANADETHCTGRKSATFLVGPGDHFQWEVCFYSSILQAFQHLECGQDAQRPVEPAARRLAVQMTADHKGREAAEAAFAANEQVGHRILEHPEAPRPCEARQRTPRLTILLRKRLTVDSAGWRPPMRANASIRSNRRCSLISACMRSIVPLIGDIVKGDFEPLHVAEDPTQPGSFRWTQRLARRVQLRP